jgi:hypothetical protein
MMKITHPLLACGEKMRDEMKNEFIHEIRK